MLLKPSYFEDLPIDYVLAGHFHKRFDVRPLDRRGFFVYSGSPFPIKKNEVGRRKVNIFEVGEEPSPYELDVPFYNPRDVELNQLENGDSLSEIEKALEKMEPNAVPILNIHGYINGEKIGFTEAEFANQVKKIAREKSKTGKVVESMISALDIRRVLENDLFDEFKEKLEKKSYSEGGKEEILRGVIKSMMETGV